MRTFHKQVSRIWPVKAVFNFKSFPTRTTSPFVLCHGDCPSCRTDAKGRHAILGGLQQFHKGEGGMEDAQSYRHQLRQQEPFWEKWMRCSNHERPVSPSTNHVGEPQCRTVLPCWFHPIHIFMSMESHKGRSHTCTGVEEIVIGVEGLF